MSSDSSDIEHLQGGVGGGAGFVVALAMVVVEPPVEVVVALRIPSYL